MVQGLQEPPRRADAVALRDGPGGRAARRRAPLRARPARPDAGRERGGAALPALLRAGRAGRLRRVGRGREAARAGGCGTRSWTSSPRPVGRRAWLLRERPRRARVAARRRGRPPAPARRPVPAEAQPAAARAATTRCASACSGPVASPGAVLQDGRLAGPVARQGEGQGDRDQRREARPARARTSRTRPSGSRRCAGRRRSPSPSHDPRGVSPA